MRRSNSCSVVGNCHGMMTRRVVRSRHTWLVFVLDTGSALD